MSRRNYILMPDSFKGTLSSSQGCRIMMELYTRIRRRFMK